MLKPGWKFVSIILAFLAWHWFRGTPSTNETFAGKNVVVCGASTGIGEQIAYRFCEQGANVLLVARRELALKNVVEKCIRLGASSASFMAADLQGGSNASTLLVKVSNT